MKIGWESQKYLSFEDLDNDVMEAAILWFTLVMS